MLDLAEEGLNCTPIKPHWVYSVARVGCNEVFAEVLEAIEHKPHQIPGLPCYSTTGGITSLTLISDCIHSLVAVTLINSYMQLNTLSLDTRLIE